VSRTRLWTQLRPGGTQSRMAEALKGRSSASFGARLIVSMVARRYDVNTNQVFGWRRCTGTGCSGREVGAGAVTVAAAAGRRKRRARCDGYDGDRGAGGIAFALARALTQGASACARRADAAMIRFERRARLAVCCRTDMRKGMNGLALR